MQRVLEGRVSGAGGRHLERCCGECADGGGVQTCKLEALRPACNKIGDFVPQYCLINSKEVSELRTAARRDSRMDADVRVRGCQGICNQCRMLQAFAEEKVASVAFLSTLVPCLVFVSTSAVRCQVLRQGVLLPGTGV